MSIKLTFIAFYSTFNNNNKLTSLSVTFHRGFTTNVQVSFYSALNITKYIIQEIFAVTVKILQIDTFVVFFQIFQ